jgi:hypothetical protein
MGKRDSVLYDVVALVSLGNDGWVFRGDTGCLQKEVGVVVVSDRRDWAVRCQGRGTVSGMPGRVIIREDPLRVSVLSPGIKSPTHVLSLTASGSGPVWDEEGVFLSRI